MDRMIEGAASELASRTSRRGFLGRTGRALLAAVGGAALTALSASPATACSCSSPCYVGSDCGCSPRLRRIYACPYKGCSDPWCYYSRCTQLAC